MQVDVSYAARGIRNVRTPTIIKVDVSYAARGFRNVHTPTIIKVVVSYCKGRYFIHKAGTKNVRNTVSYR